MRRVVRGVQDKHGGIRGNPKKKARAPSFLSCPSQQNYLYGEKRERFGFPPFEGRLFLKSQPCQMPKVVYY